MMISTIQSTDIQLYNKPDSALKILNRGPEYFRQRLLTGKTDPVIARQNRKSAVELLEESKPLYVKSESVLDAKQMPKNANSLQIGLRRRGGGRATSELHRSGGIWSELTCLPATVTTSSVSQTPTNTILSTPAPGQGKIFQRNSKPSPPPPPPRARRAVSVVTTETDRDGTTPTSTNAPTSVPCPAARITLSAVSCSSIKPMSTNDHSNHPSPKALCSVTDEKSMGTARHARAKYNGMDPDLGQAPGSASPRSTASAGAITRTPPHLNRDIPTIMAADDSWRESRTDTSSEVDQRSTSSMAKVEDSMAAVRRRVKKAIHRSRSDLTKRYSNSSDLSELSARFSRNSADLEKFFNEMGLDRSVLEPMMMAQFPAISSSDLHLFESVSSLDSADARSLCSDEDAQKAHDHSKSAEVVDRTSNVLATPGGQTSIVERNARIIKWLCNVKKATSQEEDDV